MGGGGGGGSQRKLRGGKDQKGKGGSLAVGTYTFKEAVPPTPRTWGHMPNLPSQGWHNKHIIMTADYLMEGGRQKEEHITAGAG